ncbi:MAG: hypothetical protein JXK94_04930 [Deltaproteobacteria bacterium]|nr:hypothetical protein [Deltaproteobacteria bacterium]
MKTADIFRKKLEESGALYKRFLALSRDMDANLNCWNAAKISEYLLAARKLQNEIRGLDLEIVKLQESTPLSADCRGLLQERADTVRNVLALLEKNKIVISRMLTMLADDLAKSKSFRQAAGGYFKKSRTTGRSFEQTV